jgi:hypothetical protein
MVVNLGHGRTVPGKFFSALPIGFEDGGINVRCGDGQPAEQGRTEIKADFGVIVDQLEDPALVIEDA